MPDSLGAWDDRYSISPDPYPLCYTPTAFGEGNISYSSAAPDEIPLVSQSDVFVPRSTAGPWAGLPGGGYRARSVPPRPKPPPSLQYMHASRLKDLDNYKANYRIREEVKAISASLKRVDTDERPSDETQTRRPFPYNLTRYKRYVGLENGTGMDYIIPTLQLVYFVAPLREAMVEHTCETEHCILCELGFLFHMMNLQSVEGLGYPVLPLNFVRTLRETKEAHVLGLLPETDLRIDTKQRNPDALRPLEAERAVIRCGLFFQFLLDRVHKEATTVSEQAGLIPSIFGASRSTTLTCIQHRDSSQQQSQTVFVWNLSWSTVLSRLQKYSDVFVELVASGMCECIFLSARCDLCKEPSSTHSTVKEIESLPKVLVMNLNSTKPASHLFIRRPGFLPLRFTILPDNSVVRGEATGGTEYVLQAVAFNVEGEDNGVREGHLVLHVRLPNRPTPDDDFPSLQSSVETRCPMDMSWFQFNHYVVTKVTESDVLDCAPLWKFPVYVVYAKKAFDVVKSSFRRCIFRKDIPGPMKPVVSARHILHEANLAVNAHRATFVPLTEEEILKLTEGSGMTVALDAEFVEMSHASTAHGADGLDDGDDNAVLLHSLARLSVIRGDEGERYSLPLLDHFVIHRHAPSDYLTQYSGLVPGDLEPITSQHHLATKKDVYLKLRFLVDHGCIFVGHGLQQDFRIINLVVPKEQVVDTVDLFRKPGERLVSLKFLAAFLLKQSIQTYIHDSIEDARTALELYRFYRLNTEKMPRILESLYSCGYDVGWLPDKAIERELPRFEV
ncbi:MAG: hypothetical protein KVP17_001277 [Porospora cf. gigantea B]|uniref:uncharacterized protein n=1 Tax=Porospora cf. gigantea B TaxID=2853592 RepID=UPI003571F916|nr:MAG: hypothetical protein KVP17_001277 [Porospora cf. gigantea B]